MEETVPSSQRRGRALQQVCRAVKAQASLKSTQRGHCSGQVTRGHGSLGSDSGHLDMCWKGSKLTVEGLLFQAPGSTSLFVFLFVLSVGGQERKEE